MTEPSPRLARRLRRILVMVPYAINNPGIGIDELSGKFGVDRKELVADLNLLFMCGLPGYGPGDLIDVSVDDDRVFVSMADYFEAPLRLTPVEALSIYAAGAALASLPEMTEADALRSGLAKLGRALGAEKGGSLDVRLESGPAEHMATVRSALNDKKRLRIEYFSAAGGELTTRDVDPWLLYAALGRWYLIGWDHLRSDERMFRLDRIKSAAVLDADAEVPDDLDPSLYEGAFRRSADQADASFELSPTAARWFAEYYPVKEVRPLADGWHSVTIPYTNEAWVARLLLSLGSDVRRIEPSDIAEHADTLAKQILELYAKKG